jgi:hypothetical protein
MAARKKVAKAAKAASAGGAVKAVGTNPYVRRLAQDPELRQNIREAVDLTRSAYERLANGKAPSKTLMEDKKLQRDLRGAAISLREVGTALREGPKRKRKRRIGRKLLIVAVAAGLALALSEDLRSKVLDALFGAEEEFDYTSTTSPPSPPSPAPEAQPAA